MTTTSMSTGLGAEATDGRPRRTQRRASRWIAGDILISASTLILILAAASTLPRLFVEETYRRPILLAGLFGWSVATACRYARLPFFLAPIFSGALTGVYAARFCFPELVPSTSPLAVPVRALANMIRLDWSQLSTTKAPVIGRPGFALSAIVGVWLVSALTDVLAFTLRSPIEAIVPSSVLVLVGSIVAPPEGRIMPATLFCAAAVLHVGCVTAATTRRARWTEDRAPSLVPMLLRIAAIGGLSAIVTAVALPRTGLTNREGIVNWKSSNARRLPSTVTSPMVSLKRQLLDLPDTVMFTATSMSVESGAPIRTYWRLSTLTKFNGTTWTSTGSYRAIGNQTSLPADRRANEPQSVSRVVIGGLRSSWLPTSYQAQTLDGTTLGPSISLGYDSTGDAILASKLTSPGDNYELSSVDPSPDANGQTGLRDTGTSDRDLALPADFPIEVASVAEQVAGGPAAADVAGRMAQLRALQEFFRRDFTYSTAVPPPSQGSDLANFVLRDRAGYCEQFSGAFAAMARSLGIPARVVVGFSPGRLDERGQFVVTGKNSHAWPEAYLAGIGWLPFEPTPGRGIPGAESYTGVPDQDASENIAPVVPNTVAVVPTTQVPNTAADTVPAAPTAAPTDNPTSQRWVVAVFGVLLASIAAFGVAVQRRRRLDRVERAWSDVVRRLAHRGVAREMHESERAFAARASAAVAADASVVLRSLAALVEEHRFAPPDQWTEFDTSAFLAEVARFHDLAGSGMRR